MQRQTNNNDRATKQNGTQANKQTNTKVHFISLSFHTGLGAALGFGGREESYPGFSHSVYCHSVCTRNRRKTLPALYRVLVWSLNALASGRFPTHDHLGREFDEYCYPARAKFGGALLAGGYRGVFAELRGADNIKLNPCVCQSITGASGAATCAGHIRRFNDVGSLGMNETHSYVNILLLRQPFETNREDDRLINNFFVKTWLYFIFPQSEFTL